MATRLRIVWAGHSATRVWNKAPAAIAYRRRPPWSIEVLAMLKNLLCASLIVALACCAATTALAADQPQPPTTQPAKPADAQPAANAKPAESKPAGNLVELELKLPKPAFKGTPTNAPPGTNLEPARKGPRPPLMVPPGLKNLARDLPVTSSDMEPIVGSLKLVTDGNKEATEGSFVELGPKKQWVQLDLKSKAEIFAVVVWHAHGSARIYHDVVVQVADDKDFIENVRTLFNNDHNNSSGLGIGSDKEYWETYEGKLIDAKGVAARYLRFYSNGSTADDQNHYTEVEVWGRPAK